MSTAPSRFAERREALRRRRRRRRRLAAVAAALVVVALVAVIGPWFGHLGLLWPGGGAGASSAAGDEGPVRVSGADGAWHAEPVTLRFRDPEGEVIAAGWRLDGGAWREGRVARVPAPADHSGDGVRTVDVRPIGSTDVTGSVEVRIDTTPPEVGAVKAAPDRIDGVGDVRLLFAVEPGEEGVTVEWAVVDALDKPVGEHGEPQAPSGPVSLTWKARTAEGEPLGPGTYWLRVRARDAAGNVAEQRAAIACDRPVKARVITDLPEAGRMVALTFDGGSGYAWRNMMNTLHARGAKGTFFCTGVSVDRYPEMARLAVEQGHTIANHSYDHPDFGAISHTEAIRQLDANSDAWWKACRAIPQPFFRPPYGSYTDATVKAAGEAGYLYVVQWTGDTGDWSGSSSRQVTANALAAARPGAIIVFHTQWNSAEALPAILKGLEKKNLKAVSMAELCEAAGLPY